MWMYRDKTILYMVKLTLRLSCAMNFAIYPHDTQECKLQMESCKWRWTIFPFFFQLLLRVLLCSQYLLMITTAENERKLMRLQKTKINCNFFWLFTAYLCATHFFLSLLRVFLSLLSLPLLLDVIAIFSIAYNRWYDFSMGSKCAACCWR